VFALHNRWLCSIKGSVVIFATLFSSPVAVTHAQRTGCAPNHELPKALTVPSFLEDKTPHCLTRTHLRHIVARLYENS
jgi:hypothetical protein